MAASLVKNRIRFVPMPVFDDSDELVQLELLDRKLDEMIRRAEVTQ